MDDKMIQIMQGTGEVFMRYGIKSVTMDDIARELKMSKKTLYKYVSDKNDLVAKVMAGHCAMEQTEIAELIEGSDNAIDEIVRISEFVSQKIAHIHPSIIYDLQKYYPEAWGLMYDHKNSFVKGCVESNLVRGMEEGLYRDNIDPRIVSMLYVAKVEIVFDGKVFPAKEFNFADVHLELVRYHIRGIASPKGLDYLAEIVKKGLTNF